MRVATLLVLGLAFVAAGPTADLVDDSMLGNMDIKQRQEMILKLLNHVIDNVMYKDIIDIGRNFDIEKNMDNFTKPDVVKMFMRMMKVGMLPRGEVFTIHIDRQLKEVITMFHMLYYAKDFTTFIKTACWMRLHLNEGMFVYALTVAVRHREDCRGLVLPPPYEIYPFYFVRTDVIQKSYMLKMKRGMLDTKLSEFYGIRKTDKGDMVIIDENIFDTRMMLNEEDRLRYFTEDIDLNTYYYYFHVDFPFWMRDDLMDKTKFRRWELTLYMYQQILARYYMERLSVGLGEIKQVTRQKMLNNGYWPWMMHHNGVEFGKRDNNYVVVRDSNADIVRLADDYVTIIKEAIIKGYIQINGMRLELTKPEDIEVLGKLIFGKIDNMNVADKNLSEAYRYFLIILKSVFGLNTLTSDKYFVMPSVLDHYQTAMRDPVFYQLQKRIYDLVLLFKMRLPSYTPEELSFPGVKVESVMVDKLVTYFDDYLMDMTNALTLTDDETKKMTSDMKVLVRKRRLNHDAFTVTLDVMSDKTVDSVVRMFLGPKVDNMGRMLDINKNRINFVEIDSFLMKLTTGKNTIVRKSSDMHNLVRDRMMTRDFWSKLHSMTDMRDMMTKDMKNFHTGFPMRLLLPRGHTGGMKMWLYVIVTPLKMVDNVDVNMLDTDRKVMTRSFRYTALLDKMPLGFPLDRHIDVGRFVTPNMKFNEVIIFHKPRTCDMRMRWERYVLRSYDMVSRMNMDMSKMDQDSMMHVMDSMDNM